MIATFSPQRLFYRLSAILCVFLLPCGAQAAGNATVLWLSIDGFRADYPDRVETPFFDRLIKEGATTRQLRPVFPSITFPSHVSQATGVPVEKHGIPGNSFYDSQTAQVYRYPNRAAMLEAEPIWLTAARQGVRTAVLDWPLSFQQEGAVQCVVFGDKFDGSLKDDARLENILKAWESNNDPEPLRLIMAYVVGTDSIGHSKGPDAPEIAEKVADLDALLADFHKRAVEIWKKSAGPEDTFYFLITTDHGMSPVKQLVNLERLLGAPQPPEVQLSTVGNVASIYLDQVKEGRDEMEKAMLETLGKASFLKAWRREDLPAEWGYKHPSRVGDIVVVLDTGYTFSRSKAKVVYPVAEAGGPLGMHGYDPGINPEMMGFAAVWRTPELIGGKSLGGVDSLQLHPTVASWLGITPAEGVEAAPIDLNIP